MTDALHAAVPLWGDIGIFLIAAFVIGLAGTKLAELGDRIADRTGLGEAVTGVIFLGFATALPGLAASITAVLDGRPGLAIGNAVGGIAIQTTFLAIADITYTRANLEHAAASVANMIQTAILIVLLTLAVLGFTGPDVTIGHIHPITPALFIAAGLGFWMVYRSDAEPMWNPQLTDETVEDVPEESHQHDSLGKLFFSFIANAILVTGAGAMIAHATGNIAEETGMNETLAGGLLSAAATSLPELVTTVAAVRRGALTLAVSDIVGGNFFDVLFLFAADIAYLNGSLYHADGVGKREVFLTGLTILLNIILLVGLLYRQRRGPGNIGFESFLMLVFYVGGMWVLSLD